jgi:gas vesicle protein
MRLRRKEATRPFLLGAVAGVVLGCLLAPAPGHDTRALIHREVNRAAAATRELEQRVAQKGREALVRVAGKLEKIGRR